MIGSRREEALRAALTVAALFDRDWFFFGHLSHREFKVLRQIFPEAAVIEEGEYAHLVLDEVGISIQASTYSEIFSPDGLRLYREEGKEEKA